MHGVEPVGHMRRAQDLHHGDIRSGGGLHHKGIMGKDIHSRVQLAKVHASYAKRLFHQGRQGFGNEFTIDFRSTDKGNIRRIQVAPRAAKQQP